MKEEEGGKEWGNTGRVLELKLPEYRAIFYTDTVANKQTCRDDLWAVSTEELNAIHAALSRLSAIEARCGDEEQMAGQLFLSVPGLTMDLARRCSRYLSRFLKEGK